MTNELCQSTCGRLGFPFAGTEYVFPFASSAILADVRYYGECFCSKTFNGDNVLKQTADCNTPCKGDASQMCGGPNRVTAWGFGDARGPAPVPDPVTTTTSTTTQATVTPTTTSPTTGSMGWKYMGCYTDLVGGVRTFGQGLAVTGGAANMTNANCQAACLKNGLKYCGTEYVPELPHPIYADDKVFPGVLWLQHHAGHQPTCRRCGL